MSFKENKELTVLDLFSGAGGLSLGFRNAGFKIIGGIDFNDDAIKTHHRNFPNSISISEDIKNLSKDFFIENFKYVDVIIGGPPCQGFSNANMWQRGLEDDRNKLFFEYIRVVEILKPKALLIENVPGILTKNDSYAKKAIYEILSDLSYNVYSKVLLASDYGVPQDRKRAFFVAIRKDINKGFDFNNLIKKDKVTVFDAISDFYSIEQEKTLNDEINSEYQSLMRKNSNNQVLNHNIKYPNEKVQNRMNHVPQGGNWRNVPEELWDRQRDNRHSSAYRRLAENKQSVTIDTGHMNYFHPLLNRVPTVRESARIQSFPDDFEFIGSVTSQLRQVGNAVPPLLSEAIARIIKETLD